MMCTQGIASSNSGTALVHTFIDKPYNRTGFTLVSAVPQQVLGPPSGQFSKVLNPQISCKCSCTIELLAGVAQLARTAVQVARAALAAIDLRLHSASHPRLGVVDHISCHPLGAGAVLSSATEAAKLIGTAAVPDHETQLVSNKLTFQLNFISRNASCCHNL